MTVRITWKRALALLLGLLLLAAAFVYSGLFNIAASTGHWRVTAWLLHTTMQASVRTHAFLSAPADPLDSTSLIAAAGHFERTCAACHGAPGRLPSPVLRAATPEAPDLTETASQWSDKQLFWIVRHGVKYTGMPAWPALDRTDEIRRMAAFVRRLPTMSPAEYARLTRPPGSSGTDRRATSCAGCHGSDGMGRGAPDIPVLAGQNAHYLAAALADYRSGARESAIMQDVAAELSDAEIAGFARHYAAMPGLGRYRASARPNSPVSALVRRGMAERQLPACTSCHDAQKRDRYPVLTGQKAPYLAQRLRDWRGDPLVADARKPHATMPVIARRIPEELIEPLALFWSSAAQHADDAGPERK